MNNLAKGIESTPFERDLAKLLNAYSIEHHGGDTPDFILAGYLMECINAFHNATKRRDSYYGDPV